MHVVSPSDVHTLGNSDRGLNITIRDVRWVIRHSRNRIIFSREVLYALVSLMGLYLSDATGHQKAYKELITFIDDGNELTLDKMQRMIMYHSRNTSLRAFALTHDGASTASPACNHGWLS